MTKNNSIILGLLISTTVLGIFCGVLATTLICRPVVIQKVPADPGPGEVSIDLGGGRKITAPGDGILEWEGVIDDDPQTLKRDDAAGATGVEFSTINTGNGKLVLEMDFALPETSIPDGGRSIAGYANMGVKSMFTSGATPLYIIAGISIIIGFVLGFWLKAWKMGIGFIVGGVALFIVAYFFTTYPWVLWILLAAAAVGVGFLLWDYWKKRRTEDANTTIVAAGQSLPSKIKKVFTKLVGAEAAARGTSNATKKVVAAAKKKAGPRVEVDISAEERDIQLDLDARNGAPNQPQVIMVPQPTPPGPYVSDSTED